MRAKNDVRVFAPAKINLTLHVTGQRDDGYHLLDSIVAFADVGDQLVFSTGQPADFLIEGPEASGLSAGSDNLVLQAARASEVGCDTAIALTKKLPVSSGIGGGSADAAAALRGMLACALGKELSTDRFLLELSQYEEAALRLGADVPMCLKSQAARVRGVGEQIERVSEFPLLPAVLVNPRVPIATPEVFKALEDRNNVPMPDTIPRGATSDTWVAWLGEQRNDLETPAVRLEPAIALAKSVLDQSQGCQLARMSGSGATCFGLYNTAAEAEKAAQDIGAENPGWWVVATRLGTQSNRALPQFS